MRKAAIAMEAAMCNVPQIICWYAEIAIRDTKVIVKKGEGSCKGVDCTLNADHETRATGHAYAIDVRKCQNRISRMDEAGVPV